jgi:hypothetical protein
MAALPEQRLPNLGLDRGVVGWYRPHGKPRLSRWGHGTVEILSGRHLPSDDIEGRQAPDTPRAATEPVRPRFRHDVAGRRQMISTTPADLRQTLRGCPPPDLRKAIRGGLPELDEGMVP